MPHLRWSAGFLAATLLPGLAAGRTSRAPDEYLSVQGNVARAVVEDIATFIHRIGPAGRKRP